MTVAGVLAATEIGYQKEIGVLLTDPPKRPLDYPVIREILRPCLILLRGYSEEQHARNT
jgi:hypothetical protein